MEKFYKRIGLLVVMVFSATLAFAQTTISGTVKDGRTGETLAGVNIIVKGKVIGTNTSVDGAFNLKVNQEPPLTMSRAQLGITAAPRTRAGVIHGPSVTGANLEESLFRLVGHDSYKDFPEYRYLTKEHDTQILAQRMRRVTDTSIPEDEAFRAVEKFIVPMWKHAHATGTRRYWHEYFYELITTIGPELHKGPADQCWLLAAAQKGLPIVVPGYEDSTFGSIFASYAKTGEVSASVAKSGIEYMGAFYDP